MRTRARIQAVIETILFKINKMTKIFFTEKKILESFFVSSWRKSLKLNGSCKQYQYASNNVIKI